MTVLTLEIDDNEVDFVKALLDRFPFVNIQDETTEEDTDEAVVANIRQGVHELKAIEDGTGRSRPAREFLNNL
jgi:hypothetical protein